MGDTAIEWSDVVWNPTTGCDRVSPGCGMPRPGVDLPGDHGDCYALTMAKRLKAMGQAKYQADGDPRTSGPGFGITEHPDALEQPLRWRKPRRVFVNSMSDLFHPQVSEWFIAQVFAVMSMTSQHTYQILTKRPKRMRAMLRLPLFKLAVNAARLERGVSVLPDSRRADGTYAWPLPNVWLGTSVETQRYASERIPPLLDTPAAVRFISAEPLLGPLSLRGMRWENVWLPPRVYSTDGGSSGPGDPGIGGSLASLYNDMLGPYIDWVIVGGESGPGARPMDLQWARDIRDQCQSAGVAFFMKQTGGRSDHGGDPDGWPADLRVRQMPDTAVTA